MDRHELPFVVIGCDQPASALHHRRQRQRFAAGAGAEIDHLLAGFCRRKQGRELRTLVLDLNGALDEVLFRMNAGIAGVGAKLNAQADRRPRRLGRPEMSKPRQDVLAFGLQGVDA